MKHYIIRWLRALLLWLDPPPVEVVVPVVVDPLAETIKQLVSAHTTLEKVSGDRKRRLVKAQIKQQFPTADSRRVSLLIEQVLQEL